MYATKYIIMELDHGVGPSSVTIFAHAPLAYFRVHAYTVESAMSEP